ncbi:MAG: mechanosensitive ion channel family protein, partial [Pseudomonadota bacterium]
ALAAVVAMVGLSSLGVDVAPLFAGAGVVGLAIGFGAQALIRDVFSGAFFLLDDAFRKGEYVEVGGVTGQVEKISVRSFQLRHHEGPLHTLPFGEIKQLTNYSRDWVIMKLPVRLTYDTDVEAVRKLVKKLGQEMAADPEYGHLFLEAPKSQGVVQMEDSAMIIRVKFKTKPGDQFLVRRHVYTRLRDLFAENDIHFAHREVTVRVAGTDDEEVKRKAALGAVRSGGVEATPGATAADVGSVLG